MKEIKLKGLLKLDNSLNNVDYYIKDKFGQEDNLSFALGMLVDREVHIKIKNSSNGTERESEGILMYIDTPDQVKGFVVKKIDGITFNLDYLLWNLVGKEISIEVSTVIEVINSEVEIK